MKAMLKRLIERSPFRIIRAADRNRFSAQQETLLTLKRRGYRPLKVLDGGANVGDFARLVGSVFPQARIYLVEPQPACQTPLQNLVRKDSRHTLHAVAIGREKGYLQMALNPESPSTGAHIVEYKDLSDHTETRKIPVDTLDTILSGLTVDDRTFLKLDLQGWELEALRGATQVLPHIEVVLAEASFFAQAYEPPIASLIEFMAAHGFILDDIASLSGRRRDNRAHQADLVFLNEKSPLNADSAWA